MAYLIRKEILLYIHPAFRMWTFPFSTYLVNYPYFLGLWVIILAWALSLFLLPAFRLMAKKILDKAGCWQRNMLILGVGRTGEMSLVGPRPYLPREFEKMGGYRKTILKALPGMASLWQVSGTNELTFEDRLRLEECN